VVRLLNKFWIDSLNLQAKIHDFQLFGALFSIGFLKKVSLVNSLLILDHSATARIALQYMVTQPGFNDEILMFPAWVQEWDVSFRLNAPLNTVVEGICTSGKLSSFNVYPAERKKDLIWVADFCRL
jgi:hypothetical protein